MLLDTSASTSERLSWPSGTILELEVDFVQSISPSSVIAWNSTSTICSNLLALQPAGATNPQSIFANPSTSLLFSQFQVIFFLSDGHIESHRLAEVRPPSAFVRARSLPVARLVLLVGGDGLSGVAGRRRVLRRGEGVR